MEIIDKTQIPVLKDAKELFKTIDTSMDLLGTTTEFIEGFKERKEAFIKAFSEENSMANGETLELPDSTELGYKSLEKYQELNMFFFDNMGKPL